MTNEEKPSRILVVDDVEGMHDVFRAFFKEWKMNADYASSGREAVDKHAEHPYDLIVMDANMPVMTGEEAIAIIRDMTPDVPIIAISAIDYMLESIRERFPHRLVVLTKPFSPDEMKALFMAFLEIAKNDRSRRGEK